VVHFRVAVECSSAEKRFIGDARLELKESLAGPTESSVTMREVSHSTSRVTVDHTGSSSRCVHDLGSDANASSPSPSCQAQPQD
jgi:hypothetical protein